MPQKPVTQFGKREAAIAAQPVKTTKRSGHVALLLAGTVAVGGGAYALMPSENCAPNQPGMAAPAMSDVRSDRRHRAAAVHRAMASPAAIPGPANPPPAVRRQSPVPAASRAAASALTRTRLRDIFPAAARTARWRENAGFCLRVSGADVSIPKIDGRSPKVIP